MPSKVGLLRLPELRAEERHCLLLLEFHAHVRVAVLRVHLERLLLCTRQSCRHELLLVVHWHVLGHVAQHRGRVVVRPALLQQRAPHFGNVLRDRSDLLLDVALHFRLSLVRHPILQFLLGRPEFLLEPLVDRVLHDLLDVLPLVLELLVEE